MIQLSEEQLYNLDKDALVIIVSALQDQLQSMSRQLDSANAQLSDTNRQIELLTEQIRIMNQRQFGRKSESSLNETDGPLSMFDSFNEAEGTCDPSVPEPVIEEITISSYRRSKSKGKRDADLDGLPVDRLSISYKCNGINLATNTMANWVIKSADNYLSLMYDRLHELIYDSKVIHADETPVKVMRIDNQKIKDGKKTQMWVYRNRVMHSTHPIILYDWQISRKADHPRMFLKDFSGTVVTDDYEVYHKLEREREDLTVADRKKQRQAKLTEKVDAYFEYVKEKYDQVTHNSSIGKALKYSINQEKYLRVFLTDGNIPPDNNPAEQAIRPFTIERKNFVLMATDNGAKASAMLYSLAETAKANEVNTYKYFELLLTEIPKHMEDNDLSFIDELLPWSPRVQKECPSKFKKSQFFNVQLKFIKSSTSPAKTQGFVIDGTHD